MELVHYVRVLRRRWRLLALCAFLGVLVGLGTLLIGGSSDDISFYRATHTLTATDNTSINLNQLAALTTEGEVPKRVADRLGGSPAALASQITATARPDLALLQITAVGTDPRRTEQLANTFAEEVVRYQTELVNKQRDAQVQTLKDQKEEVQREYGSVFDEAAKNPDKADFYKAQKDALIRRATDLDNQISTIERQAAPKTALASTSTAEAVPFKGSAVAKILEDKSKPQDTSKKSTSSDLGGDFSTGARFGPAARAGLGALAGLLLGAVLALVIDRLDPRLRTRLDAEEAFGWPVVAELPELNRRQQRETHVIAYELPRSRSAEAFRVLRSALLFANVGSEPPAAAVSAPAPAASRRGADAETRATINAGSSESDAGPGAATITAQTEPGTTEAGTTGPSGRARVIMVTSPGPSEGKTTTTANLAAVLGEAGYKVVVVNCDFRRPRLREYLGGTDDPAHEVSAEVPNVTLIAQVMDHSADANPADVVAQQRKVIAEARANHDIVLLDTAPLLTTNDAADVLNLADQVVVVSRVGRTTKEAADLAAELLERREAPVVGVVLVGTSEGPSGRYYYYGGKSYYLDEAARRSGDDDTSPLEALSDKS